MIDVEKLALLARIKLDSEEKKELQKDFEAVLSYISELQKADTGSREKESVDGAEGRKNILREDVVAKEKYFSAEELVDAAPQKEDGYVKVKHVFE